MLELAHLAVFSFGDKLVVNESQKLARKSKQNLTKNLAHFTLSLFHILNNIDFLQFQQNSQVQDFIGVKMSVRFSPLCRFLTKIISYILLVSKLTEGATVTDLRFRFYSKTRFITHSFFIDNPVVNNSNIYLIFRPHLQYLEITPGRVETIPSDFLRGRVLVLYCHGFGDKPDDPRTGKLILGGMLWKEIFV